MKECTPTEKLSLKLNVLISCCDGLLLLLESSRRVSEEESESTFTPRFILSGEVIGQNSASHSHWTKYINWNPNAKTIPALNDNLKVFLSATHTIWSGKKKSWTQGLKDWTCSWFENWNNSFGGSRLQGPS